MLQSVRRQIIQSPAWLGLSSPNSPSLQSRNASKIPSHTPQPHHSHQQSNLSTIETTSSTLLAFLRPLPKAQALLLQMASLASRLFEVSPKRSLWLSSFHGSFPTFLSSQMHSTSLLSLESSAFNTKQMLAHFTSLQTQLFEAVVEFQEVLDLEDAKQKIINEFRSKDPAILAFANKLKEAERVLDFLIDYFTNYRRLKRLKSEDDAEYSPCAATVASQLNLSDIRSYAHTISYTTFVPPESDAVQSTWCGALPPAPKENEMHQSQLNNFADLDVGLPKIADDKVKAIEPPSMAPADSNSLTNLAIQALIPPNTMAPPGWKPGMPVEMRSDLPPPPPEWKPGDPVPMPPFYSLPIPAGAEEQQPRPSAPYVISKATEPMQVPHVQLDILDQDDDSSDYSTGE